MPPIQGPERIRVATAFPNFVGCALAAAAGVILFVIAAQASARPLMQPLQLAQAIELRAERTSFAKLEAFGSAAARGQDRESLNRLAHVAQIFLNQSEFDRFEKWNDILARQAALAHDPRYIAIAADNELKSRYDRGDTSLEAALGAAASKTDDWYAKVYDDATYAFVLTEEKRTGEALRLLSQAEGLIPSGDPYGDDARGQIWSIRGIALTELYDLQGSAAAFDRSDFQYDNPLYPRPDFDNVYNMAVLATDLGEGPLATRLAAIHHRLALRSDLPHLRSWDAYLCGFVAQSFGTPNQVMACLSGLSANLSEAQFIAGRLFPMRAIAEARLGEVAAARADLSHFRALARAERLGPTFLRSEAQVQAEIDMASGNASQGFAELRKFGQDQAISQSRIFNSGVHQLTTELQNQLDLARRDAGLEQEVIRNQRWVAALALLMVLLAVFAFVWQRRLSLRFRQAREKAESANRSKSEFLANMSHEIRTPLNGVVGVADLLASANLGPREKEMVEIIRGSGQSLERLLSDVLDLARVEAGRMTIENAAFQAGDLVRSVAALCRLRADEKGLALEAEIAPELEAWVMGDSTRVRQILTNLLSNAVKFTASGRVGVRAFSPKPGRLRFVVADTGVGFDAEDKKRLFDRFEQADGSITRRYGGSGLGLAISRQLALLMGGEFDCSSTPGEGSIFWFEVEFPPADAPDRDLGRQQEERALEPRALKVLLADDHITNQTVIRMMLTELGAETTTVDNGAEAVEAARQGGFDLILMDMQMPVMDGLEATRRIRRAESEAGERRARIVMLTANALPEHREAGRLAGADGHLSKPLTVAALVAALEEAVAGTLEDEKAVA
ncbi:MAG: ATP-binding protein [Caulobacteraceae bacterium]